MNKTLIIGITVLIVVVIGGGTLWFSQSDSVKVKKILTRALTAEEQDVEVSESEDVPENGAEEYMDNKDESPATAPVPTTIQKKLPAPPPAKVSPTPAPAKGAVSVDKAISAAAQDDVPEAVEPDVSEDGADSYQD